MKLLIHSLYQHGWGGWHGLVPGSQGSLWRQATGSQHIRFKERFKKRPHLWTRFLANKSSVTSSGLRTKEHSMGPRAFPGFLFSLPPIQLLQTKVRASPLTPHLQHSTSLETTANVSVKPVHFHPQVTGNILLTGITPLTLTIVNLFSIVQPE